jgi:hypothetical protein
MKKHNIFLILGLFTLLFSGCKYDFIIPEEVPVVDNGGQPISFANQIAPIFSNGDKCTSCHKTGGMGTPDFSNSGTVYSLIVPKLVDTSSPESSKIYVNASSGTHYAKVSATEAALILTWIKEGTKNN